MFFLSLYSFKAPYIEADLYYFHYLKSPELSGVAWFELSAVQLGLVVYFLLKCFLFLFLNF